ncbi:glycoside hydrolase family 6 protein [Modestobacter sp. VKM Ac-2985]|uniref:glycoside hydrolase family 6 protein n=1 Tax=Modestobacter sp. VKM Ac-2985 TaxID=3004139 RepID=UPI0022AB573B|nr:glycoside hydrolase family 6 protein [Modestobacter sp. VKM Ac-2985]MCZ2836652.1 glycoside hydrolase family 6 protein [Modestobacter sp. VKM Ac-2985]
MCCGLLVLLAAGSANSLEVSDVVLWNGPKQVDRHVSAHPELGVLAQQPTFNWIGDTTEPRTVGSWVQAAEGQTVPLVLYGIPDRDLGSHSAGGFATSEEYLSWVGAVAYHLGDAPAMIVVEPDAVAMSLEMPPGLREERLRTLGVAIDVLARTSPNARIYLDASTWVPPTVMAGLLQRANVGAAEGISVNVANHLDDQAAAEYADTVTELVGVEHFIIDSSRNGLGSDGSRADWCNVRGLGLGRLPGTLLPGRPQLDGLYWIKTPGVSDGTCNGGPPAGQFWLSSALDLAANARS